VDRHPLGFEDASVPAAERVEFDEAVLVLASANVADHEPHLVHVGCDGHRIIALALECSHDVAHRVGTDSVDGLLEFSDDEVANAILVAGDTACLGEFRQEIQIERNGCHARNCVGFS